MKLTGNIGSQRLGPISEGLTPTNTVIPVIKIPVISDKYGCFSRNVRLRDQRIITNIQIMLMKYHKAYLKAYVP